MIKLLFPEYLSCSRVCVYIFCIYYIHFIWFFEDGNNWKKKDIIIVQMKKPGFKKTKSFVQGHIDRNQQNRDKRVHVRLVPKQNSSFRFTLVWRAQIYECELHLTEQDMTIFIWPHLGLVIGFLFICVPLHMCVQTDLSGTFILHVEEPRLWDIKALVESDSAKLYSECWLHRQPLLMRSHPHAPHLAGELHMTM